MEKIFNDPILRKFLSQINHKDHQQTIKQLLYIGINMVSGSISMHQQIEYPVHYQQKNCCDVMRQINNLRNKINEISHLLTANSKQGKQNWNNNTNNFMNGQQLAEIVTYKNDNIDGQSLLNKIFVNNSQINEIIKKNNITPKVTQTVHNNFQTNQIKARGKNRYHLDDHQFKEAMIYPISPSDSQKKNKKKKDDNYNLSSIVMVQRQKSRPKLQAIDHDFNQKQLVNGHTHHHDKKVKSKIKALVDRDRQKYNDHCQSNQDSNKKNEYFDELKRNNIQYSMDQSSHFYQKQSSPEKMRETQFQTFIVQNKPREKVLGIDANQALETITFKQKKKKQIKCLQEKKKYESVSSNFHQDIDDNNSSSFSEFSLGQSNTKRQVGKISRRKN